MRARNPYSAPKYPFRAQGRGFSTASHATHKAMIPQQALSIPERRGPNEDEFSSCSSGLSDSSEDENNGKNVPSIPSSSGSRSSSSSNRSTSRRTESPEERQFSVPASVAASTAPSAALCVEGAQGPPAAAAAAAAAGSPIWLQGKLKAATSSRTHVPDPIALSEPLGGGVECAAASGVTVVATEGAANYSAGGAAVKAPGAAAAGAAGSAESGGEPAAISGGLPGPSYLGSAEAATATMPLLSSSCSKVQQKQQPQSPLPEEELPSEAAAVPSDTAGTEVGAAGEPAGVLASESESAAEPASGIAAASATAEERAAAPPSPVVAAASMERSANGAVGGAEVLSGPCASRLMSLSTDSLQPRSGTTPQLDMQQPSSSSSSSSPCPSRLYRWHVGGYAVWTAGGGARLGVPGGVSRVGGTHCEMMQELRKQADLKASVDKAVLLFNKEGLHAALQLLGERKLIEAQDPAAVARFLYDTPGLDKKKVGEVLGDCSSFSILVLQSFASLCDYRGLSIDEALRQFLSRFQPPGEAQQVYRLLYRFAGLYVRDNKERGLDLDTVHFLAYAILMLHTDRHNPKVRRKMTKEQFRKIVAAGGAQLPDGVVDCMYDRVVVHEFRLNITDTDRVYSRLVNDPRALRHLPASLSRPSEMCQSPTLQQQVQQQRSSSCCRVGVAGVGAAGAAGVGVDPLVGGVGHSSSSSSSSGGPAGMVSLTAHPHSASEGSACLCVGEEGSGAEAVECIDTSLFIEGSVFVKLCRNGRMKRRLIRVSPDYLLLLWGPPNSSGEDSTKQAPSSLPLEELVDITVGCLYSTAKKFELTDEMEARCVSLQFVSRRLDLFAADLSNSTFTRWIGFFHQKVAQQQQQRQQRLLLQQQEMSHQKRQLLLQESRMRREEAAARNFALWRDEVLPHWESSWSCEAVPVAVPVRPSPLAVFVAFAASSASALVRLPRSVVLKHLNRSHKGSTSTSSSSRFSRKTLSASSWTHSNIVSLRRIRRGAQRGGAMAATLGRAASRQVKKLAALPAAFGACCSPSLAVYSRHRGRPVGGAAGCGTAGGVAVSMDEEGVGSCSSELHSGKGAGVFRRDGCSSSFRSATGGWGGPQQQQQQDSSLSALVQRTNLVGSAVATEANAYIHLSHLGTTWVGRYSLDRGRRTDTATQPAFVRLWLGGLPGELRGKLWLIALGNEQNVGVPLREALMQLRRLQNNPQYAASSPPTSSSHSTVHAPHTPQTAAHNAFRADAAATAAIPASATVLPPAQAAVADPAAAPAAHAADPWSPFGAANGGASFSRSSSTLEGLRRVTMRGIPYLMNRKIGEGPLLLTTSLDELRDEVASAAAAAAGPAASPLHRPADVCNGQGTAPVIQGQPLALSSPLGPTAAVATATAPGPGGTSSKTLSTFVPMPKPRKQQQQQQQQWAEREGGDPAAVISVGSPIAEGKGLQGSSGEDGEAGCCCSSVCATDAAAHGRPTGNSSRQNPASALDAPHSSSAAAGRDGPVLLQRSSSSRTDFSPGPLCSSSAAPATGEEGLGGAPWGPPVQQPFKEGGGGGWEEGELTIAEGVRALLEAYVLYRPDVGYVRGMDCLASMLLCFLPLDLAFVALTNLLPAFHLLDFFCPALPCNRRSIALKFDFFESMLRLRLPHLYRHLAGLQVIPDLYLIRWMETLFCRALPFATLCRTWDGLLLMGEAYCFQVALGLLKYHESELLCNSFEGCLSILNRHAHPTADEDGAFDSSRFFKTVKQLLFPVLKHLHFAFYGRLHAFVRLPLVVGVSVSLAYQQYGRWVANQRMSEEKAELLELVACSTV
ncbi:TBC domain-containing protein, putative [Eimeria maxima]|uniref:TBC domain-containing protein, putative n=1 Tax=Eimeria maxima TaxID=5804 RepID=U6M0E6_EIMMA|nr:TBC domain-containing protein, putative [Eimeria maxima]CDJ57692.1 TBC domain-containing protein, putative [Eimeria maxima]